VHHRIAAEFTDKFTRAMSKARYGNALVDGAVDLGPLINETQLARVEKLVEQTVAAGATVLTGGARAADRPEGFFYPPTVLADCRQDMPAVKTEKFAPVMPIVVVHDFDEAITYANDSDYGLASSLFTQDVNLIMRAVQELHCGETYVNQENQEILQGFHAGWRKSGIGGDDGKHGVLEFTNTHVVYLNYDPTANPA
jgi:lactaldehyde dehydrogenase/glycolaldehyde dehydrogenase